MIEYVFWHASEDKHGRPAALPNLEYRRAWDRACRRAKVENLHTHDLRRGAAVALRRAGVAESVCMKLMGHATDCMFRRYSVVDDTDLRVGLRQYAEATQKLRRDSEANEA